MIEAPVFEAVCDVIERCTALSRLEARGTVRLALRHAGLQSRNVTSQQMQVVIDKVLPEELESRGVLDVPQVCDRARLAAVAVVGDAEASPDAIFSRIAGDA